MTKVLYTGSFDPITKGHMNIIEQASGLFDEVIIAILYNPSKKTSFFTVDERLEMISEFYKNDENIKVVTGTGAAVDIATLYECKAIIRGLRNIRDFDQEIEMTQINREISNNTINTICLFADKKFQFISSSMVKEVFSLDKDISKYVDPYIKEQMLIRKKS